MPVNSGSDFWFMRHGPCSRPFSRSKPGLNAPLIGQMFLVLDFIGYFSKLTFKIPSAGTLKFWKFFGSIIVRTSRFPFVRSEVYSSLFTRTETKINDIWFEFPRNRTRSLKDILNFASTSIFKGQTRDGRTIISFLSLSLK